MTAVVWVREEIAAQAVASNVGPRCLVYAAEILVQSTYGNTAINIRPQMASIQKRLSSENTIALHSVFLDTTGIANGDDLELVA
ncbi:hypothetical protein AVEN_257045-1 [Araneus ventricosus]|uniref:Uncharacterized protein n=1 Tax=Araneus ventricosus TaxID=182803 RepID=A0A4Y2MB30_ARAVE|nr:hypothetical protein AVEN_257045-1 [Araneus ventricosus]